MSGAPLPAQAIAAVDEQSAEAVRLYWHRRAAELARGAEAAGVIITIERLSRPPFAMGRHMALITTREKR